jgi:hypothetical protein
VAGCLIDWSAVVGWLAAILYRLRLLKSAKLTLEDALMVGVSDRVGGYGKIPKQQQKQSGGAAAAAAGEGRPEGESSSSSDDASSSSSSEDEDPAHFSSGKRASQTAPAGKKSKALPLAAAAGAGKKPKALPEAAAAGEARTDGKLTEEQRQQVVELLRKFRAGKVVLTKQLQQHAAMGKRKAKCAFKLHRSVVPEITYAESHLPSHLEVVFLPHAPGAPYGGIFLFSQSARMVRPVKQLLGGGLELLGTLEQSNLDILCPDGGAGGSPGLDFTHAELAAGEVEGWGQQEWF